MKKQLYIVDFYWGDEKHWEPTVACSEEEAIKNIIQMYQEEHEELINDTEAFAIPNVDGYKIILRSINTKLD